MAAGTSAARAGSWRRTRPGRPLPGSDVVGLLPQRLDLALEGVVRRLVVQPVGGLLRKSSTGSPRCGAEVLVAGGGVGALRIRIIQGRRGAVRRSQGGDALALLAVVAVLMQARFWNTSAAMSVTIHDDSERSLAASLRPIPEVGERHFLTFGCSGVASDALQGARHRVSSRIKSHNTNHDKLCRIKQNRDTTTTTRIRITSFLKQFYAYHPNHYLPTFADISRIWRRFATRKLHQVTRGPHRNPGRNASVYPGLGTSAAALDGGLTNRYVRMT